MASRDCEKEIIDNAEAKNVNGSSCDKASKGWLAKWSKEVGRTPGKCSYLGCSNDAAVGGHLWIKNRKSNNYNYIAPICYACNSNRDNQYYEMKSNVAYLKINSNSCIFE